MTIESDDVPLCVDLDGTLIRSDLLYESALALLKQNPVYALALLPWLLRGRAYAKREIARRASVDVETLPYDPRVVELLRAEKGRRRLVLCTASDRVLAEAVASHVGGFAEVLASDGSTNLAGRHKAAALAAKYGERGFDYAGNERRDLAIWRHARRAFVANASDNLATEAAKVCHVTGVMPRESPGLRTWVKALRLHQWLKNLLVFVPLLAAHLVLQPAALARTAAAFVVFGLCASGAYVLNDLLDLRADRRHPRKRKRPFASGRLPLAAGLIAAPALTLAAFSAAFVLSRGFALILLCYYVLSLTYSWWLKRIVMLDVVVLAALYTVRIIAGAIVLGAELSFWLLAFSMFLFLSLAMLKRYTELRAMRDAGGGAPHGRGYHAEDYQLLASLGGASGYLAVLVLALYINSNASEVLYRHPQMLWLLCPLLLYWISRVWVVAHRGAMNDDPVIFAISDQVSRAIMVLGAIVAVLAIR